MRLYKFFDANFWKYNIFVQWEQNNYVLIPSFYVELDIKNNAPVINIKFLFLRWFLSLTYSDQNISEYKIIENTFEA